MKHGMDMHDRKPACLPALPAPTPKLTPAFPYHIPLSRVVLTHTQGHRLTDQVSTTYKSLSIVHSQARCATTNVTDHSVSLIIRVRTFTYYFVTLLHLQGRLFSYSDTHRHRLGTNYQQIPVNCPFAAKVRNYQRDGPQCVTDNQSKRSFCLDYDNSFSM